MSVHMTLDLTTVGTRVVLEEVMMIIDDARIVTTTITVEEDVTTIGIGIMTGEMTAGTSDVAEAGMTTGGTDSRPPSHPATSGIIWSMSSVT